MPTYRVGVIKEGSQVAVRPTDEKRTVASTTFCTLVGMPGLKCVLHDIISFKASTILCKLSKGFTAPKSFPFQLNRIQ